MARISMTCATCPHTPFQHAGGAGRCHVPGCDCLAYVAAPDPAQFAAAQEAVRLRAIERAQRQKADAEADLVRLGVVPLSLQDAALTLIRDGATVDEAHAAVVGLALERGETGPGLSSVQRWARKAGLGKGRGRRRSALADHAIELNKQGRSTEQIAADLRQPPWRVARFLASVSDGDEKK